MLTIITIICAATRLPEAVPLRDIKPKTIAKALTKFFTVFGLLEELQTDQGSNFMSHGFQQVVYEFGIWQISSSAYRLESPEGIAEVPFSIKDYVAGYCLDNEKD